MNTFPAFWYGHVAGDVDLYLCPLHLYIFSFISFSYIPGHWLYTARACPVLAPKRATHVLDLEPAAAMIKK